MLNQGNSTPNHDVVLNLQNQVRSSNLEEKQEQRLKLEVRTVSKQLHYSWKQQAKAEGEAAAATATDDKNIAEQMKATQNLVFVLIFI